MTTGRPPRLRVAVVVIVVAFGVTGLALVANWNPWAFLYLQPFNHPFLAVGVSAIALGGAFIVCLNELDRRHRLSDRRWYRIAKPFLGATCGLIGVVGLGVLLVAAVLSTSSQRRLASPRASSGRNELYVVRTVDFGENFTVRLRIRHGVVTRDRAVWCDTTTPRSVRFTGTATAAVTGADGVVTTFDFNSEARVSLFHCAIAD